jgi:amidase
MNRIPSRRAHAAFGTTALLMSVAAITSGAAATGPATQKPASFKVEEATIAGIGAAFADGTLDCVGLTKLYLERIAAYDDAGPAINSVATVNPNVLATAASLDAEYERFGPRSRLHCVPVLLKDNIDTYDMPTTNGSVILKDAVPPDDAYITARLRAQGALILGKAEMGEFAGGSYNTINGQVVNPYNLKRGTGGSSAGSGAAIAANFAVLAVGTDTSTSVRGPAAYNGIVGLRPTTGLVSRDGIAPKNLTFDSAGPMARTVTDTALMMNALTGKDPADPLTVEVYRNHPEGSSAAGIDYTQHLRANALQGKRLGVVRDFFGGDPEIEALANEALATLEAQGAELVNINLEPEFLDTYVKKGGAIRTIADYRFKEEFEEYLATFGPEVPKTVEEFIEIYERDVNQSPLPVEASVLNLLKRSLTTSKEDPEFKDLIERVLPAATDYKLSLFEDHGLDALVFPYQTSFASPINNPVRTVDDPTHVRSTVPQPSIFAGYSSIGFPGIVVPMGTGSQGLPMDISFMGKPYSEGDLLGYAYDYEQASRLRAPSPLVPSLSGQDPQEPTRALPELTATITPATVLAGQTRPRALVRLTGPDGVVKGKVVLKTAGRMYRAALANGKARIQLAEFAKPGRKTVTVRYLGSAQYQRTSEQIVIRVQKKR